MYMEIPILVGVMLVVLLLGFVVGTIVQKVIDEAKLNAEREKWRQERAEFERERQNATRAYLHSMDMMREERRRREEERKVFLVAIDDLKTALRGEQIRVDIYKRGGRV